jgi:hypothetical protein
MVAFSDESVQSILLFIADKERDKKTQLYQEDSRLDDRMSYAGGETCRLLVTEKVPGTPFALIPAIFLSPSLSTTPSKVT